MTLSYLLVLSSAQPVHGRLFPRPSLSAIAGHASFLALAVLKRPPTTHKASLPLSSLTYRVAYSDTSRDFVSSPGVTHQSSLPCRPHTPWCDGLEPNAFASVVQAQPFPIFGRPVHLRDRSHRLRPGSSPHTLRISPHGEHPVLQRYPYTLGQ